MCSMASSACSGLSTAVVVSKLTLIAYETIDLLRNPATSPNPASRSGGDLHTCAVTKFCRFVSMRFCRTAKKASQIALTLLVLLKFAAEDTAGASGWATTADSFLEIFSVSLYNVCETSSSLVVYCQ